MSAHPLSPVTSGVRGICGWVLVHMGGVVGRPLSPVTWGVGGIGGWALVHKGGLVGHPLSPVIFACDVRGIGGWGRRGSESEWVLFL